VTPMTESEWLACTELQPMLESLRGKVSERKWLLLAVACWRTIWKTLSEPSSRRAVEILELLAGGQRIEIGETLWIDGQLVEIDQIPWIINHEGKPRTLYWFDINAKRKALWLAANALRIVPTVEGNDLDQKIRANHSDARVRLLYDIFANPFRPVTVDPAWRTSTVVSLAQGIYDERAFDRLPILADALEDAGCTNADILIHCRQPGEHVRGCWVVDRILGKK